MKTSPLSTKTFLIGGTPTPFTIPTPLLPPHLLALPENAHLRETSEETFILLATYLRTSNYNPPARLPLSGKLRSHIALYDFSTRYEIPGLAFLVLTKVHALLALLVPHDRGYAIGPAEISCGEKWSLVRLVYGCRGEGGGGMRRLWAGFLAANWGWYVKSGLVNGRIDARSDVGRALEEVQGLKEDLLVALGDGGWFLPPVEEGTAERMGQQWSW
ncbi:hypothetical protein C7212DRAFT_365712 [Tuber magnatum]|uniref:Uncharacterized protein n=1 Tax=Tuber magnatum TaxID=42249 RepID=A0A317SGD2_9PEZI|nr:hypothetical protein C7212DRAFT_365712 [Tuber magnatum]